MLTLTSQYALKALIYLVRHADAQPIAGPQIAQQTSTPRKYLLTVLHELVEAGILDSTRGRGGGFRMVKAPREVSLFDAVSAFEPRFNGKSQCPFGNAECSDAKPCLAHEEWKKVNEHEERFLRRTSMFDVAVPRKRTTKRKK